MVPNSFLAALRRISVGLLIMLVLFSCQQERELRNVGDIPFDASVDDPDFEVCDEIQTRQYYGRRAKYTSAGYRGEKKALVAVFYEKYEHPVSDEENGYVTIRFLVNCKGQSGRFRVQEMDFDYQPKKFDPQIVEKLLTIVRELDGWIPVEREGKKYDFYQYLSFRLERGRIVKIMP